MSEPITVVLLDDHPLVMEGLNNRLNREPGIQVIKTFSDPLLFLSEVEALRPDVVVMDIRMPQLDGFEVVRRLKDQYGLSVKIILLSGYNYHEFQLKAYDLGVHAYLSKQATYGQIINAIHQSMLGHVLIPEKMLSPNLEQSLTATEREVLNRIALEMTNKEIAQDLAISPRTVEYHITSITQKFGVKSRVGAVVKGYQAGILGDVTLPEKR
ncbi:response regulator transcription factor [Paenibacillus sp. FSL H7-0942]|uniref:response regulator transcription factor n=1 Tax=unclassified Paenibacillus TaxID=185978 RepID=UPI0003E1DC1B|nr:MULTISPECIES: response regulator transcription factor [unclassified Paenibacillus]ETT37452.1 DNA-binding response regulator, luxR family protein [Paenibacillus sp. FSL R5-192]ETT52783.1 DNA-binding response regulator, luxR family protein [Paenibacillus sp. FSL H7-689]